MGRYARIMQVVHINIVDFLILVSSTNDYDCFWSVGVICSISSYSKCSEKRGYGQMTFFLTFVCFCPLQQERKKDELKEVEDVDIRVFPPPCVFMRPPITRPSPPSPPKSPPPLPAKQPWTRTPPLPYSLITSPSVPGCTNSTHISQSFENDYDCLKDYYSLTGIMIYYILCLYFLKGIILLASSSWLCSKCFGENSSCSSTF